jgi:hypothetical protein
MTWPGGPTAPSDGSGFAGRSFRCTRSVKPVCRWGRSSRRWPSIIASPSRPAAIHIQDSFGSLHCASAATTRRLVPSSWARRIGLSRAAMRSAIRLIRGIRGIGRGEGECVGRFFILSSAPTCPAQALCAAGYPTTPSARRSTHGRDRANMASLISLIQVNACLSLRGIKMSLQQRREVQCLPYGLLQPLALPSCCGRPMWPRKRLWLLGLAWRTPRRSAVKEGGRELNLSKAASEITSKKSQTRAYFPLLNFLKLKALTPRAGRTSSNSVGMSQLERAILKPA